ncbi:MAG: DUF2063 domain-containing protein, partial [Methylophilaceae bacterium]|nr:DUF2063 domain-containing protein [Methylophilaceae bacterium]
LMSLAHYEWVELAVATSDATPAAHDPQGDWLEGRPVLAPALMLLRYAWPVHRISPRFQPKVPLSQPVHLLVFRDRRDAVRFMELAPASARLVGLLQEGRLTGRQALERVMEEMCLSHPEQMFQAGRQLLQMLKAQGVLWGVSKV